MILECFTVLRVTKANSVADFKGDMLLKETALKIIIEKLKRAHKGILIEEKLSEHCSYKNRLSQVISDIKKRKSSLLLSSPLNDSAPVDSDIFFHDQNNNKSPNIPAPYTNGNVVISLGEHKEEVDDNEDDKTTDLEESSLKTQNDFTTPPMDHSAPTPCANYPQVISLVPSLIVDDSKRALLNALTTVDEEGNSFPLNDSAAVDSDISFHDQNNNKSPNILAPYTNGNVVISLGEHKEEVDDNEDDKTTDLEESSLKTQDDFTTPPMDHSAPTPCANYPQVISLVPSLIVDDSKRALLNALTTVDEEGNSLMGSALLQANRMNKKTGGISSDLFSKNKQKNQDEKRSKLPGAEERNLKILEEKLKERRHCVENESDDNTNTDFSDTDEQQESQQLPRLHAIDRVMSQSAGIGLTLVGRASVSSTLCSTSNSSTSTNIKGFK